MQGVWEYFHMCMCPSVCVWPHDGSEVHIVILLIKLNVRFKLNFLQLCNFSWLLQVFEFSYRVS